MSFAFILVPKPPFYEIYLPKSRLPPYSIARTSQKPNDNIMFDNQQADLVERADERADERSRANVFSGVSRDLQWTFKDYLKPSHPQQAVTQAVGKYERPMPPERP